MEGVSIDLVERSAPPPMHCAACARSFHTHPAAALPSTARPLSFFPLSQHLAL